LSRIIAPQKLPWILAWKFPQYCVLSIPKFIDCYLRICNKSCIVHLKTDNTPLFDFALEFIKEQNQPLLFHTYDVDKNPGSDDVVSIRTRYEMLFRKQGEKIKYCRFGLFGE